MNDLLLQSDFPEICRHTNSPKFMLPPAPPGTALGACTAPPPPTHTHSRLRKNHGYGALSNLIKAAQS